MKRNDRLNEVFRKFRQRRALRRFISLFSVIVLLVTVNSLKMNADTLERIPGCGLAEHAHGAECFDEVGNLICGLAEHVHTDACYQERPKGILVAENVEPEVREADSLELELDDVSLDSDAIPEESIPANGEDAIQSAAVDAVVEELDGLSLDESVEGENAPEEQPDGDDEDPAAEDAEQAEDAEPAEDAEEEEPGTREFSLREREFVLASELAGAMGLELEQVQDVAAVENEDAIGIEPLDGDWLIYAAREFDVAELAFILDESIEVVVLTDGVPLTAPESAPAADDAADPDDIYEIDIEDIEEETADVAADIDGAQASVEDEGDAIPEEEDLEINAGNDEEEAPADEDAPADEEAPANEDAPADEEVPADEDAPADEDETVNEAGEEAEGEKVDEVDEADEDSEVDEEKTDEEKVDEEKADEEKSDEEKADEEKAHEEKSDEEKTDAEKADEEKAEESDAESEDGAEPSDAADDEDAGEGEDAADGAEDESAEGDASGESGASGSEDDGNAERRVAAPAAGDYTLIVDLSEEQVYPLSLRGLMASFQTGPVAAEVESEPETEAEQPQAEPAESAAEAEEPEEEVQVEEEQTEVWNEADAVIPEETEVGFESAVESDAEAGEMPVVMSDDEAFDDEIIVWEAVDAVAAEVEVTMAAPEPVAEAPAPVIDPEAALALSIAYDDTLLSVEETEEDWLITPVASFEKTELVVGGVYTIAFINCTVEVPVAMPAQTFEGATDYVTVKVEAGEGAFPEGTTMQLADIEDEGVLTDIGDAAVTDDFVEVKRVHAVDITFRDAQGNEIEPLIPISVVMGVREIEQNQEAVVVHVDDDGNAEVVEQTEAPAADEVLIEEPVDEEPVDEVPTDVEDQGGDAAPDAESIVEEAPVESVSFMADAFSIYAMVVIQKIETKVITAEGETYNITVSYGPEAEIPMGATLSVSEIEGDAAQGYLERTEESLEKAQIVTRARFFDIKIMDGETEVQPAVPVTVQAVLADETRDEAAVPCAVHFADETVGQPDVVEAAETGETVVFRAASFSVWGVVYTVDFHWTVNGETFDYSIPGGDCASLRELLGLLNMVADDPETETNELDEFMAGIESVTFSDPELVQIHKIEEDTTVGALRAALEVESEYSAALTDAQREEIDARALTAPDWALFSLRPFTTPETLTIAMDNGDTFDIAVTDAQITTRVMASDGNAYKITLTFGPEAQIPLDAELAVSEFAEGTIGWSAYYTQSRRAVGMDSEGPLDFARFFDIEIRKDGEKIEPQAPVSVTIELADAPEATDNALKVVHFVENVADNTAFEASGDEEDASHAAAVSETPVMIDDVQIEQTGEEGESATVLRFEADSFSTWGVITQPTATQQFNSDNVSELVGKGFTISHNNQYFKNVSVQNGDIYYLEPTNDPNEAAIWYIRPVEGQTSYVLYTIDSTGNEQQVYFEAVTTGDTNRACVKLRDYGGNWFSIAKSDNNTYTFLGYTDKEGVGPYYLNHSNGNAGLAGYKQINNEDKLTLNVVSSPAQDNKNYFVILKQDDKYYLVLNDGRLEEVTIDSSTGKFQAQDPMMWTYATEGGDHYLTHTSYARSLDWTKQAVTWYYSYIDPNSDNGFNDPITADPIDQEPIKAAFIKQYKDEHNGDAPSDDEINVYVAEQVAAQLPKEAENNAKKAQSRIIISSEGGKNYIRSATENHYIGVQDGKMVGCKSVGQAAEVIFADIDQMTVVSGWYGNLARNNMVNHIDIGIEASAELHIPIAPGTYYDAEGHEVLKSDKPILLRVTKEKVPITSQDIKNAKLSAYWIDPSDGKRKDANDVYFVTGYSGNAYTTISANQVRIEGQFRVSMAGPVPDNINDPYDADETIRAERLAKRITYKVAVQKKVTFDLTIGEDANAIQLYNAKQEKMTSTSIVELSDEFDYWSPRNECPALYEGFDTAKQYWQEHDGHMAWLNDAGQPNGIIPAQANGNSGMDFILGGSKDVHVVVITKLIVNENNVPIKTQTATTSDVKIWQSNIVSPDTVKGQYLTRENGYKFGEDNPTNPWGYWGDYKDITTKTIPVSTEGYGTVYDYNIPTGMIGIQETGREATITDRAGKVWTYDHTYYATEYVKRNVATDTNTKYHYTKDYVIGTGEGTDEWPLSVPEVLGLYRMENPNELADEPFVEFYVYNVYKPTDTTVEVKKDWKKEDGTDYNGNLMQNVTVDIGRYKLVPDDTYNYNQSKQGKIEVWQENYSTTAFVNDRDLKVGDTVTLEIRRQYHEAISYSVNGGETTSLTVYENNHQPEWVIDTLNFTVPASGKLFISFDDPWNSVSRHPEDGQGYLIVRKDDQVLKNVNTGYVPNSPEDYPNMVYKPEMQTYTEGGVEKQRVKVFDTIELNSSNNWLGTSKKLDLYDENGNQYQYFIIEEHGAENTMHVIGTNADGTIMTANTPDSPLKVTNIVPSTSITIKKTDKENTALPGAEFELWWLKDNCWTKIKDIKDFDETTVTAAVGNLFDGRYRLKETKAPDGYLILNQYIYFNIYNQHVILADENGGITDKTIYNNMIEIGGNMLTVQNEPGKPLPSTGGSGTTVFYLAGGLLTLLALALLIAKRRAD